MLNIDEHKQDVDDVLRLLKKRIPEAELYELGALLITTGCFLVSSAIPDLKIQLVPIAELAHQLLNQEKDATTITDSD